MMDKRLLGMLESLLLNVRVINGELSRLQRDELLDGTCLETRQLCMQLHEAYLRGMEVLQHIEKNSRQ